MQLKQVFNKGANDYDSARKQLIPCFDDFYGTALDIITFHYEDNIRVLDLGAGTGLFSILVSERYPNAEFTLLDISDLMLEEAKKRFSNTKTIIDYVIYDYSKDLINSKFDLIISALSIHHLTDIEKKYLFKNIFHCLNNNGLFINADQVLGDTPYIEKIYRSSWLSQVEEKGVTNESLASALASALERMKEDKMSTLSDQLYWLKNANFSDVNCWYQYYSFVVYSACKKIST